MHLDPVAVPTVREIFKVTGESNVTGQRMECPLIVYTDLDSALCQAIAQTVGQPMEWKIPR